MKSKNEVDVTHSKSIFYAVLYNNLRQTALDCGYALALHGSMLRDMDLVAVPWTDDVKPVKELVKLLNDKIGNTIWKEFAFKSAEKKPHGKISYTLCIMNDWYIDLCVVVPTKRKNKNGT